MKRLHTSLGVLSLVGLSLAACDTDPTKGKEMAQAAEAVEPSEQAAVPSSARTVVVTQSDGALGFVGAKVTDKHEGSFEKFEGKLVLPEAGVAEGSVELSIDMASVAIEPAKLKKHLLSPDFFDVEKFPRTTFRSTSIKPAGEGKYEVTGNLELHGQTKSITFPAAISLADGKVVVDGEFGINRKDFGIVYPGMPDDLIKDEVLIKIALKPSI